MNLPRFPSFSLPNPCIVLGSLCGVDLFFDFADSRSVSFDCLSVKFDSGNFQYIEKLARLHWLRIELICQKSWCVMMVDF